MDEFFQYIRTRLLSRPQAEFREEYWKSMQELLKDQQQGIVPHSNPGWKGVYVLGCLNVIALTFVGYFYLNYQKAQKLILTLENQIAQQHVVVHKEERNACQDSSLPSYQTLAQTKRAILVPQHQASKQKISSAPPPLKGLHVSHWDKLPLVEPTKPIPQALDANFPTYTKGKKPFMKFLRLQNLKAFIPDWDAKVKANRPDPHWETSLSFGPLSLLTDSLSQVQGVESSLRISRLLGKKLAVWSQLSVVSISYYALRPLPTLGIPKRYHPNPGFVLRRAEVERLGLFYGAGLDGRLPISSKLSGEAGVGLGGGYWLPYGVTYEFENEESEENEEDFEEEFVQASTYKGLYLHTKMGLSYQLTPQLGIRLEGSLRNPIKLTGNAFASKLSGSLALTYRY